MSQYTVCRARDLKAGDLFLDPMSGALAKLNKTEPSGAKIKLSATLVVAHSAVTIELPENRPMRRQWRAGEQRGDQKI